MNKLTLKIKATEALPKITGSRNQLNCLPNNENIEICFSKRARKKPTVILNNEEITAKISDLNREPLKLSTLFNNGAKNALIENPFINNGKK